MQRYASLTSTCVFCCFFGVTWPFSLVLQLVVGSVNVFSCIHIQRSKAGYCLQTQLTNRSCINTTCKLTISHKLLKTRKLSQFSPTRQNQAMPFWSEKYLKVFSSGQSAVCTGLNGHVFREERESSYWPLPSPRSVESLGTLGDGRSLFCHRMYNLMFQITVTSTVTVHSKY